jgi:Fe-S-cluster containining protein
MNRSSLTADGICAGCGRCCRTFRLWFSREEGVAQRLAYLTNSSSRVISQQVFPDSDLVEISQTCRHLTSASSCGIYNSPDRPPLCADFPDNLFNKSLSGTLILDDDHARGMIAAYKDQCPAVDRIGGLTVPEIPCPPAPPLMTHPPKEDDNVISDRASSQGGSATSQPSNLKA